MRETGSARRDDNGRRRAFVITLDLTPLVSSMAVDSPIIVGSFAELKAALVVASRTDRLYISGGSLPTDCQSAACSVGVDEAGRGPVLGPMVYGVALAPAAASVHLRSLGVDDSKALTASRRETIFNALCSTVAWEVEVIAPSYISTCMYRRTKTSLNDVSHSAAIALIERMLSSGADVVDIYVDTVGPAEKYEEKLQRRFPESKVIVKSKADALYAVVGAASIMAKVVRDAVLSCQPSEPAVGSGYPGDPVTKSFLADGLNAVFGFDDVVRFSWSTAERLLADRAISVDWEDADEQSCSSVPICRFFPSASSTRLRHQFFTGRQLTSSNNF